VSSAYDSGATNEPSNEKKNERIMFPLNKLMTNVLIGLRRGFLGCIEYKSGNMKHLTIGASSAGCYDAMNHLRTFFEKGYVSRELIDSSLTAYNNSLWCRDEK
jgi:hypothetical protein